MSNPQLTALLALAGATNQTINTLRLPPEERLIVYATGKMFRNGDPAQPWRNPEVFRMPGKERARLILPTNDGRTHTVGQHNRNIKRLPAIPLVQRADGQYEYLNVAQWVRFVIKLVEDKDEFVQGLLTPGAHVIYDGHARYGRGACFGSGGSGPGEMWEEGTGAHPNKDGLFRMGFPFIGIEAKEILEHGYTANLAEANVLPNPADCDPALKPRVGELRPRTLAQINPALVPWVRDPDPTKLWWSYGSARNRHVVHVAGWENTFSTPDDIGAITPTCRCFSHMGCYTFRLNYPIVRGEKRKNWKRSGNERYAYWTKNRAGVGPVHYFLQHLLTYNQFNAYQSWEASLKYAVAQSNNMLIADGDPCTII